MSDISDFKVKRLGGVTRIQMVDKPGFRAEMAAMWKQFAPLLSDHEGSGPSFEDLRSTPEAAAFVEKQAGIGREMKVVVEVQGIQARVIEKKVLFFGPDDMLCAVSRWNLEAGVSFSHCL